MKKLPKLYKNTNININNNKTKCLIKENSINKEEIINKIFDGLRDPYNVNVIIKTNNKVYDTFLVSKTNDVLTTLENEKIKLEDIYSIEIK